MPQSVSAPNTRQGSTPPLDPTVIKLIDADGPRLGRNRECWDTSRRIIRKLRGERYCNASNEWLAKFIQEQLFTFDYQETAAWYAETARKLSPWNGELALLGCNDRYFLLTVLLGRQHAEHPWLFDRCREVERDPDGYIDLWARFHYKSTIITFAGAIQEVMCDPEITIAIFSVIKPIAAAFLNQIKEEFERNEKLKQVYPDVLYAFPRQNSSDGRPAKWGVARGITVKRKSNPKEATIEAHGLIDGQPTSRHFRLHIYDDVVTQDYLSDDQIRKTTERWELADNLGSHLGVRKWMAATRYHFADTCGVVINRKSMKPRIYPATDDGTLTGKPVFLPQERWNQLKNDQRSTVSAQLLLNPIACDEATFSSLWLTPYDVIPAVMNVYVLVDPSMGVTERSDRTAIAVIGIDQGSNKYLLDGVRHRMTLSERWDYIKQLKRKWERHPGVKGVKIGYERYGMQVDLEVMQDMMTRENNWFPIEELKTKQRGQHAKPDRIRRLEPDIRERRFLFPCVAYNGDFGAPGHRICYWSIWTEKEKQALTERIKAAEEAGDDDLAESLKPALAYNIGQITFRPMRGLTRRQRDCEGTGQNYRIVTALQRRDEQGNIYDLTCVFFDELLRHPFALHDDLIDAASRIYDIDPQAADVHEAQSTKPLEVDYTDIAEGDVLL
jgi:phage terminase large subunit-like protein